MGVGAGLRPALRGGGGAGAAKPVGTDLCVCPITPPENAPQHTEAAPPMAANAGAHTEPALSLPKGSPLHVVPTSTPLQLREHFVSTLL